MLDSPRSKVLSIEGFDIYTYFDEGNEPAHVHVKKGGGEAKVWMKPTVVICWKHGLKPPQIKRILRILNENYDLAMQEWNVTQARKMQ